MMTAEQNDRLTRVGPGTPCGELLRRYWQPLLPAAELTEAQPKKRLRIMGEDLVVFRDLDGNYGCVQESCAHRGVSLYYGFCEKEGIRCPYHGWKYDRSGQCVEQPLEPQGSQLYKDVKIRAYPVQKLSGILFAYMGPDPSQAPLLPTWDVLAREDGHRVIQILPVHECNWLQCEENTADSVHTYFLHGYVNEVKNLNLSGAEFYMRPIEKYEWAVSEWGIEKELVYGGDHPEIEIRPPLIFPNILRIPQGPVEAMHWRVPIDDFSTRIIWLGFIPSKDGSRTMSQDENPPFEYLEEFRTEKGDYDLRSFYAQDQMAWETQGVIFDRTKENLGATDRGIVLFRKMLEEQISRVEQGLEPSVAVVRDPDKNRCIDFPSASKVPGGEDLSFVKAAADT